MGQDLFSLNFNHWGVFLLSIIPALINFGIFFYAVFFLPQNKVNKAFFLFVLLLGIGQTVDGLMRMSISAETALLWCRMSTAPFLFAISFGLLFTLRFTGWNKKLGDSKILVLLFLPPMLFEFLMIARLDKYTIVKSELWNWIANPESTPATNTIFLWMSGIGLIILSLLWLYYFKERGSNRKKIQSLFLAIGFSIPFLGGVTTELVFPLIFHLNGIPLVTPLITTFSMASLIAITKYNMLDYSPKHQWNNIVENMNEGILIINNNCRIMFANKLFCDLTENEAKDIEGKEVHSFFMYGKEQEKLIKAGHEECHDTKTIHKEIGLITKSGREKCVLIVRSPYLDSKRNIMGSILIITDITERKKAEEQLYQSEERLSNFIQDSLLSIYFFNPKTKKIMYANPAFLKLTGYLREELGSITLYDFINHPKEDIDLYVEQTAHEKQHEVGEREWKRKDGKIIQVYINASYISINNSEIIYITAQDISKRKEAEKELLKSEVFLKETQKISKIGSYVLDIANGKWKGSEELERIFGLSSYDEHSIENWVSIIHPEHKKMMTDYFEKEVIGKKARFDKEYKIINRQTNEEFWVNGIGELELDFNNVPIKMMGTIQDITERKEAEERQKIYIKQLSEIAFMQSHHVRAPIASILGLLELVNFEMPSDPKNIEVFNHLKRTSLMCDNVIKAIIDKTGEIEDLNKPF